MTSSIDTSLPIPGRPTTASVRSNFAYAKSEIESLQAWQAWAVVVSSSGGDDAAAIQAAVTTAASGGTVLPDAIYRISSAISVAGKVRIIGGGMYQTTIIKSGTGSQVFNFSSATCDLCEVSNLRITKGTDTHTSQFVFDFGTAGALGVKIERVLVEDCYAVIGCTPGALGVNDVIIRDCEFLRIEKYGMYLEYAINWHVTQVIIGMNGATAGTIGIVLGSSTEGGRFDSVFCLGGEHSWAFVNTLSGTSPKEHTLTHCIGDGGGVTCFYATGLRRTKFIGCWASSQVTGSRGFVLDGTDVFGVVWEAGEIVNMAADAMQIINGASRIIVANSLFSNWGLDAALTHYGIQIDDNAATSFTIVNNWFSDDVDLAGSNTWRGIGINTGSYTSYVVMGNQFNGCTDTVVDAGTASVSKSVSDNH